MGITSIDWFDRTVFFDGDIDVPITRAEIRALEASEDGIVFDEIISVTGNTLIGEGRDALTITLINAYKWMFNGTGSRRSFNGNFVGEVIPTPGIFFQRELSLAFAATTGPLSEEQNQSLELARDHARAANMQTKPNDPN